VHVNKRYFPLLRLEKATVLKLISWKHSFKRLNEEYEIAKKKKQALDNLFETGRISQATRDSFENDITAVIMEIEKQQKDLLAKMQGKTQELESQIKTLETLFANYEIEHVVGEIDEESYQREITLLTTGLETAKHELEVIKEATNQLCPPVEAPITEPSLPAEESEAVQNEPVENEPVAPAEVEVEAAPSPEEPAITTDEAVPEQPEIESEETVPADMSQAEEDTPQVVEETPEAIEDQPQVTEEMPEAIEETPEIMEETPEVTAEMPQVIEDVPQEIEDVAEVVEETPEITEETPQVMEETPDVMEDQPELTEEVPEAVEDAPEAMEEMLKEAHPQKAPEEAQPEIIVESIPEQEQDVEEAAATAETDENTENQEEEA
jgi:methyl-accepting chemotaxis protein